MQSVSAEYDDDTNDSHSCRRTLFQLPESWFKIERTDSDGTASFASLVRSTVKPNFSGLIKLGTIANKIIHVVSGKPFEPRLLLLCSFPRS
jgi:hypothetical protein